MRAMEVSESGRRAVLNPGTAPRPVSLEPAHITKLDVCVLWGYRIAYGRDVALDRQVAHCRCRHDAVAEERALVRKCGAVRR
jgi:hypothetical protein